MFEWFLVAHNLEVSQLPQELSLCLSKVGAVQETGPLVMAVRSSKKTETVLPCYMLN